MLVKETSTARDVLEFVQQDSLPYAAQTGQHLASPIGALQHSPQGHIHGCDLPVPAD